MGHLKLGMDGNPADFKSHWSGVFSGSAVHLHILCYFEETGHLRAPFSPPPTSLPGNVRVPQCDASQSLERKQRKCRGCWAAGSPPYCSIIFPKENFLTKRRDTFYRLPGTGRASRSVITDLDKTENDWECEAKTLSDWKCQCCDWTSVNLGLK